MNKPNCYECAHRRGLPGNAHSRCNNFDANVHGDSHGIRNGWFMWPLNFDPVWLESCDGFSTSEEHKSAPTRDAGPIAELMALLR